MSKLYYGNGVCTIESSEDIGGVRIWYKGNISISGANNEKRITMHRNNQILILSLTGEPFTRLFSYTGRLEITDIDVGSTLAEKIPTTIHRVMDYAELITSNAEDMTEIKSENLSVGYAHGSVRVVEPPQILTGLHTSRHGDNFYLMDGTKYSGDFHIHFKDMAAMTGKSHIKGSQLLYIKKYLNGKHIGGLVPTNNIPRLPKKQRKRRRKNPRRKRGN